MRVKKRDLSRRETQVAKRLAMGHSGPEIAKDLGIGYEAVRNYMRRIRAKKQVHSQREIANLVQVTEDEEITLP